MASRLATILVAGLKTTAKYVDKIVVECYSNPGLTTLVSSKTSAIVWDGTFSNQKDLISFTGLTAGTTYYLRAGIVAPLTNITSWSATFAQVAGATNAPAPGFVLSYFATNTGLNFDIAVTSPPADIDHYEAYWTYDGSAPPAGALPKWKGLQTPLRFPANGNPGQTINLYMRAINTENVAQTWTSLGPAAVDTTINRNVALATGTIGSNALDNPDFEINATLGSGDLVAGWSANYPAVGSTGTWTTSVDTAAGFFYAGTQSVKVSLGNQTIANGATVYQTIVHERKLPVVAGQIYTISAVARADRAATAPAGVGFRAFLNARIVYSDTSVDDFQTISPSFSAGFQPLTTTFTVPTPGGKTISYMLVFMWVLCSNASGSSFNTTGTLYCDVRFDNVSCVRAAVLDGEVADGPFYARTAGTALQNGFPKGLTPGAEMLPNPGFEKNDSGAAGGSALGSLLCDDWTVAANDALSYSPQRETSGTFAFDGGCNLVFPVNSGFVLGSGGVIACAAGSTPVSVKPGQVIFWGGMAAIVMNTTVPAGMAAKLRFQVQFYDANGNPIAFQSPGDTTHSPYHDAAVIGGGGGGLGYTLYSFTDIVPSGASVAVFQVVGLCQNTTGGNYTFSRVGANIWSDFRFDDCFMFLQLDPSTAGIASKGLIVPALTGKFVATYSGTSLIVWWDGTNSSEPCIIYRADGAQINASGNATFTGISPGTYWFYPYWDESANNGAGAVRFVNTSMIGGGTGTNATYGSIFYTTASYAIAQQQALLAHIPFSLGGIQAVLPGGGGSGGAGSGGGGGSGKCLKLGTKIRVRRDGVESVIAAEDACLEDYIYGPNGWEEITMHQVLPFTTFIRITLSNGESLSVTPNHIFTLPDGRDCRADHLCFNEVMVVDGSLATILAMKVVSGTHKVAMTCEPTHLFYAGEVNPTISTHNFLSC